jgi:hypothetical protein
MQDRGDGVFKLRYQHLRGEAEKKYEYLRIWVSNLRPARLYYAARGHICKLCIYYQVNIQNFSLGGGGEAADPEGICNLCN